MANPGMWRSDRRLYVNRDHSRVVPGDSKDAAFVLVGAGGEIPIVEAQRLGLVDEREPDVSPPTEPAEPTGGDAITETPEGSLESMDVPENVRAALTEAGYADADAVDGASDEDLLKVDGVGHAMLARLRESKARPKPEDKAVRGPSEDK